jgi:MFS family permease
MFFESARSGALPSTVPRDELHAAYALSAATWSTTLGLGSALGGLLVAPLGVSGVFVVDAATFCLSALLLVGLRLPPVAEHPDAFRLRDALLLRELRRGLVHARSRGLGVVLTAKSAWGIGGGLIVLLQISAKERFTHQGTEQEVAVAMAWLFAGRGVGTGLGPILARALTGSSDRALRKQIGVGFAVAVVGYAAFAVTHELLLAFLAVTFAHMGGSVIWTSSTAWWQRHVDDAYRGRIFALEFLGVMILTAVSSLASGFAYDATGSLTGCTLVTAAIVAVLGALWVRASRRSV